MTKPLFRYPLILSFILIFVFSPSQSQPPYSNYPSQLNSTEIYHELKKLNTLGKVLYLAAHPDDENQRLITYFSNEKLLNTAYLSLTRGDGGQNLVGPEIRESLGIIRTQELLGARRVDGGQQYFTRANDFGYSKSAEETLEIWNKSEVLADVVWVIRQFRPDVIITRFPPDARGGHGHHTSSAVLAKAAFEIAGDPDMYPEQLRYVSPWQPKRIFVNTGRWWNNTISEDTPGVVTLDVGEYNDLLGESYAEIAARSRSNHKSQGFGATGSRGEQVEFLELMVGDEAKENDAFYDIDNSWNRVEGGDEIGERIDELLRDYDFEKPELVLHDLLEVREMIGEIEDEHWKILKINQVDELIRQCTGLYLEIVAEDYFATPGGEVKVNLELINRSYAEVKIENIEFDKVTLDAPVESIILARNKKVVLEKNITISDAMETVQPYWLKKRGTLGMYKVTNQQLIGKPENDPCVNATITVNIDGHRVKYKLPLVHKWNDPVKGEQYKPFVVLPPVTATIAKPVYIFKNNNSTQLELLVKAFEDVSKAVVSPILPDGWKSSPQQVEVTLNKNEEKAVVFTISPPKNQDVAEMKVIIELNGKKYDQSYHEINYDHIPSQTYLPKASTKLVNLDVKIAGTKVGYIHGAGDDVPLALRNMGYEVDELDETSIDAGSLGKYDAIMLGIRALNTIERIDYYMPLLLKYAENGGTFIIQYNTNHRLKTHNFAPFKLKLSRDRVSQEDAEVRILKPDHEVLNSPNKITLADFDNWAQERGLYFPNEWDDQFEAILSMNDTGEDPKNGSLLIAKYGKGHYVYTGLSWFRELPVGVPGAYRILANIISLGNGEKNQ